MIKGISYAKNTSDHTNIPLLLSDHSFYQTPDTLKSNTLGSPSVLQVTRSKILGSDTASFERQRINRLFQAAEEREKRMTRPKAKIVEIKEDTTVFEGSTTRIYSDFIPSYQKQNYTINKLNDNFLLNITEKTIDIHYKVRDTSIVKTTNISLAEIPKKEIITGFDGKPRGYETSGWYILVLLISISIFAWGKSLYQKYLLQIISSVYNYQVSIQLFRDKNALFRNLSIILQFLFPINVGLLIYFLIDFYHFNHVSVYPLANLAIYSFTVFLFFRIKIIIYKFLGLLFKTQEDFNEIHHHLNIFTQTLGIVLLPFVISMPFLNNPIKNVFLIGVFISIGIFVLLFFFRGFQIVTRKQIPLFFLILYLCAVEILPVILLVKTSYTII